MKISISHLPKIKQEELQAIVKEICHKKINSFSN
jgi:hypothetical protein